MLSKKQEQIFSVCNGVTAPISEIPDDAFALGLLGKGYAIYPDDGIIVSPVNGKIENIAKTKHAYSILTGSGLDILVHIGVDTVELNGEGFESCVCEGQSVKVGDTLAKIDIEKIHAGGYNSVTAVIVTNHEAIENIAYKFGNARAGKDAVMYYTIRKR
ncbi:MAG: PTS glucose transporter subunit IIA [Clostridia bacterium]|nr:PTS glucose transporter subunit IIA [Clostridia bacterium]